MNHIVQHYAGSLAYGTSLPTSDTDIRGVFCASPLQVRTPFYPVKEVTLPDEEDGKLYELSTFLQLYTQGNPNILETLWVADSDIIATSPAYAYLREYRERLLSKKVAFTFSGYALAQLKRIKGHNKWLNKPHLAVAPSRNSFVTLIQNFSEAKIMKRDFDIAKVGGMRMLHYGNNIFGIQPNNGSTVVDKFGEFNTTAKTDTYDDSFRVLPTFIVKFNEEEYKRANEDHKNYSTWKNNRNEKRSELEEQFGYDTKHAMHLVRLLRMGEEILTGQGVIVKRPDAVELLDIRAGAWGYDDLVAWAEAKDNTIRGKLYKESSLPKAPNIKLASNVLLSCQDMCWE